MTHENMSTRTHNTYLTSDQRIPKGSDIPLIIHQIWLDFGRQHKPPPQNILENMSSIQKYHPEWKYFLWDDKSALELLHVAYPWLLETWYNTLKPVIKVDIFRMVLLHHYGGFYMDADIRVEKPFLSQLIHIHPQKQLILACSYISPKIYTYVSNYFMGSVRGHPFWIQALYEASKRTKQLSPPQCVLDAFKRDNSDDHKISTTTTTSALIRLLDFYRGGAYVLKVAGPLMLTKLVHNLNLVHDNTVLFLNPSQFCFGIGHLLKLKRRKSAQPHEPHRLAIHDSEKSWIDKNTVLKKKLIQAAE